MDTSTFDLVYVQHDPQTNEPSAAISVKPHIGVEAGMEGCLFITHCLSFIELDSEIRRLHAELDELRARAKKKFYKAQAASNGA